MAGDPSFKLLPMSPDNGVLFNTPAAQRYHNQREERVAYCVATRSFFSADFLAGEHRTLYNEFEETWRNLTIHIDRILTFIYEGKLPAIPLQSSEIRTEWQGTQRKLDRAIDNNQNLEDVVKGLNYTHTTYQGILIKLCQSVREIVEFAQSYRAMPDEYNAPNYWETLEPSLTRFQLKSDYQRYALSSFSSVQHSNSTLLKMTNVLTILLGIFGESLAAIERTYNSMTFIRLIEPFYKPLQLGAMLNHDRCLAHIAMQDHSLFERYQNFMGLLGNEDNPEVWNFTCFEEYRALLIGRLQEVNLFEDKSFKRHIEANKKSIDKKTLELLIEALGGDKDAVCRRIDEYCKRLQIKTDQKLSLEGKALRLLEKCRDFFILKKGQLDINNPFMLHYYQAFRQAIYESLYQEGNKQLSKACSQQLEFLQQFESTPTEREKSGSSSSTSVSAVQLYALEQKALVLAMKDAPLLHLARYWELSCAFYLRNQKELLWYSLTKIILSTARDEAHLNQLRLRVLTYVNTLKHLFSLSAQEQQRLDTLAQLVQGSFSNEDQLIDVNIHFITPLVKDLLEAEQQFPEKGIIRCVFNTFVKPIISNDFTKLKRGLNEEIQLTVDELHTLLDRLYDNIQLWINYCFDENDESYLQDPDLKEMFDIVFEAEKLYKEWLGCQYGAENKAEAKNTHALRDNFIYLHLLQGKLQAVYEVAFEYLDQFDGSNLVYSRLFQLIRFPVSSIINKENIQYDLLLPYFAKVLDCYMNGVEARGVDPIIQDKDNNNLDDPDNEYGQLFQIILFRNGRLDTDSQGYQEMEKAFLSFFERLKTKEIIGFSLGYIRFFEKFATIDLQYRFRTALFEYLVRNKSDALTREMIEYYRSLKIAENRLVDSQRRVVCEAYVGTRYKPDLIKVVDEAMQREDQAGDTLVSLGGGNQEPEDIHILRSDALQRLIAAFLPDERGYTYRHAQMERLFKLVFKYRGNAYSSAIDSLIELFINFYSETIRIYDPAFSQLEDAARYTCDTFYTTAPSPEEQDMRGLLNQYAYSDTYPWSPLIQNLIRAFFPPEDCKQYFLKAVEETFCLDEQSSEWNEEQQLEFANTQIEALRRLGFLDDPEFMQVIKERIAALFDGLIQKLSPNSRNVLEGDKVLPVQLFMVMKLGSDETKAKLVNLRLRDVFLGEVTSFCQVPGYAEEQLWLEHLKLLKGKANVTAKQVEDACLALTKWLNLADSKQSLDDSLLMNVVAKYINETAEYDENSLPYVILRQFNLVAILPDELKQEFERTARRHILKARIIEAFNEGNIAKLISYYDELLEKYNPDGQMNDELFTCFHSYLLVSIMKTMLYQVMKVKNEGLGANDVGVCIVEKIAYTRLLEKIETTQPTLHKVCKEWIDIKLEFVKSASLPTSTQSFLKQNRVIDECVKQNVNIQLFRTKGIQKVMPAIDNIFPVNKLAKAPNGFYVASPTASPVSSSSSAARLGETPF